MSEQVMSEHEVGRPWLSDLTAEIAARTATAGPDLIALSHAIHARPEVRFQEHHAAASLAAFLGGQGFSVTAGVAGMDTAFLATRVFGVGGPTIGVFCEYDALEGIGHACGHNIIAAAGAGAAVSAARWLEQRGDAPGRIVVIGSPGEEGGGGKARLIGAGALAGVDASVMIHPASRDVVHRPSLGRIAFEATFTGRAAHAAAAPHEGLNALDAATLTLVSIGLLRQQMRPDSRVHAIVVEGGDAVNVIPERSRLRVFVRSGDPQYLRGRLAPAVLNCVAGAAMATGTTVEMTEAAPAYDPMNSNPVLADLARDAFMAVGREPAILSTPGGSTDMGNVSQLMPVIHPYIGVTPGLSLHTRDFAAAAGSPDADRAVLDGATILGALLAALLARPRLVTDARQAFDANQASGAGHALDTK
ncbi:MAG: M20 family metallopeptidase [Streptosporangiaceae bacterium]